MKLREYLGKAEYPLAEEGLRPFSTGDWVGVEVELENITLTRGEMRLPQIPPPNGWIYHIDDSLRNNGLEFVFNGPSAGGTTATRLESLISWIKENKQKPDASSRTSVHVHVDAGNCTAEQLLKWIIIFTVYEPLLFEIFAPERKNSNFCVSITDSFHTKQLIAELKRGFASFYKEVAKDRGTRRYSSLNLDALSKFGSLEFRHLGGTYRPKPIIDWINILLELKAWAMRENTSIGDIFHGPSKYYCQQMTSGIFNEEISDKLTAHDKFTDLYLEGIRTAQEIFLDEKIPEIPSVLLPRIEEVRQKKAAKKIQLVKEQLKSLSVIDEHGAGVAQPMAAGDWLQPDQILPQTIPARPVRRVNRENPNLFRAAVPRDATAANLRARAPLDPVARPPADGNNLIRGDAGGNQFRILGTEEQQRARTRRQEEEESFQRFLLTLTEGER